MRVSNDPIYVHSLTCVLCIAESRPGLPRLIDSLVRTDLRRRLALARAQSTQSAVQEANFWNANQGMQLSQRLKQADAQRRRLPSSIRGEQTPDANRRGQEMWNDATADLPRGDAVKRDRLP